MARGQHYGKGATLWQGGNTMAMGATLWQGGNTMAMGQHYGKGATLWQGGNTMAMGQHYGKVVALLKCVTRDKYKMVSLLQLADITYKESLLGMSSEYFKVIWFEFKN